MSSLKIRARAVKFAMILSAVLAIGFTLLWFRSHPLEAFKIDGTRSSWSLVSWYGQTQWKWTIYADHHRVDHLPAHYRIADMPGFDLFLAVYSEEPEWRIEQELLDHSFWIGSHPSHESGVPGWTPGPGYVCRFVIIPHWALITFFSIVPTIWLARRLFRRRRRKTGRCVVCGYDLRASPARCPECGTAVGATASATIPAA